ncbi:MAG: D-aminoacyl-tRNA deacylase [Bacteroidota bacterium]
MRVVIQRVLQASVAVDQQVISTIQNGLLVFVGIETEDNESDVEWLGQKIVNMRIFPDDDQLMNQSLLDIAGDLLLVSQFTLHASTKKGNRPSFTRAAKQEHAVKLYNQFAEKLSASLGKQVKTGRFGADMKVSLMNDGPVTITMDSRSRE